MDTTTERLQYHYPEVHEQLQLLPHELVTEVGETALRLTHLDMHPVVPRDDGYEVPIYDLDFSQRITDPEFDSSQLEAEAVEAAHAGKEKLSSLLHSGSTLLRTAHDELVGEGANFEPKVGESEQEAAERVTLQRQSIFERAKKIALEAASDAKLTGREGESVQALEALILIEYLSDKRGQGESFRYAVAEGLGSELLAAARNGRKIVAGSHYDHISDTVSSNNGREMLELATGKKLNYNFEAESELNAEDIRYIRGSLNAYVALMAAPEGPVPKSVIKDSIRRWSYGEEIVEKLAAAKSPAELKRLHAALEISTSVEDYTYSLQYEDPFAVAQLSRELGHPIWLVNSLLGYTRLGTEIRKIDEVIAEDLKVISKSYPEISKELFLSMGAASLDKAEYESGYLDFKQIKDGLDKLKSRGLESNQVILRALAHSQSPSEFAEMNVRLADEMMKNGMDPHRMIEYMDRTRHQTLVGYIASLKNEAGATDMELAVIKMQLVDTYKALYEGFRYPASREGINQVPDLEEFPLISQRLQQLGISSDLATEMFAAWTTYNEFKKYYYSDGLKLPTEKPSNETMSILAMEQASALVKQLEAIENFARVYGNERLHQVIETFGIHNFSRYKAEELADQYERWQAGEPIRTVVASARYDWNSYTSKSPLFDDGQGEGVFHFEVSSSRELAEVAVQVGKHARAHNQEPDLRWFIVHAHANAEGMVLGPDRQSLDVVNYERAARSRAKLPKSEINDYRRHLGPHYEIILQGCTTAGQNYGRDNFALTVNKAHDAVTYGLGENINGVRIKSDGSVEFITSRFKGDGRPSIYKDGEALSKPPLEEVKAANTAHFLDHD